MRHVAGQHPRKAPRDTGRPRKGVRPASARIEGARSSRFVPTRQCWKRSALHACSAGMPGHIVHAYAACNLRTAPDGGSTRARLKCECPIQCMHAQVCRAVYIEGARAGRAECPRRATEGRTTPGVCGCVPDAKLDRSRAGHIPGKMQWALRGGEKCDDLSRAARAARAPTDGVKAGASQAGRHHPRIPIEGCAS